MADNVTLPGTGVPIATDDVGGFHMQRVKLDVGGDGLSVPVVGALPVTGPATDAQIRAAPIPISGSVTISDGSGPVTVDGTVAVTGTFWQATQPVSAAALPLPTGAATEATLAAMNAKLLAAGQALAAASQPVVIASDQSPVVTSEVALILTGQAAQTAVIENILPAIASAAGTNVDNYRAASVQVVSTGTGGTFIFEQSNDGTNWAPLPVFNAALTTATPITAAITATASAIVYSFPIRCRFARLRIVTPITGGSIQAFSRLSADPWAPAVMSVAQPTAANLLTAASLQIGSNRAGYFAAAGIWYDDTSTVLAGAASFTGTSRDASGVGTATQFNSTSAIAQEVRACAESDQTGTLWLEVSRDNSNWRRIRSVATAAITGGGFAAELVYLPSWRYWRIGYTNGATLQTRFTIGTIAVAA